MIVHAYTHMYTTNHLPTGYCGKPVLVHTAYINKSFLNISKVVTGASVH